MKHTMHKIIYFAAIAGLALSLTVISPQTRAAGQQDEVLIAALPVQPQKILDLPGDLGCHTQGIAVMEDALFVSCVQRVQRKSIVLKYALPEGEPKEWKEMPEPEVLDITNQGMYHPSGIDHDGQCLWIATAHYRQYFARSEVMCLDPRTLEKKSSFMVNDHIGAVASLGDDLVLINWDSRDFYRFTKQGKRIEKTKNPTGVAYQDCRGDWGGGILCSGAVRGKPVQDLLAPAPDGGFRHDLRMTLPDPGAPLGREGFTATDKALLFAPEDYPGARLFVYPPVRVVP